MCLDIHPEHPFLLAVGLYDGAVAVYDLREGPNNPIYKSTARMGKHTDPVWQVNTVCIIAPSNFLEVYMKTRDL